MVKRCRIKSSCALSITRKDNILKTIIELSHQEVKAVLLNGALKAFVDNIQPSDSVAVIGTQNSVPTPAQTSVPAPVKAPVEAAAPVQSAAPAAVENAAPASAQSPAPTQEVAYKFEDLQLAAAKLAREGKREELAAIIKVMGFTAITDLKPEQYNAFAAKLREIGGVL